jgi:hypothetical protein
MYACIHQFGIGFFEGCAGKRIGYLLFATHPTAWPFTNAEFSSALCFFLPPSLIPTRLSSFASYLLAFFGGEFFGACLATL